MQRFVNLLLAGSILGAGCTRGHVHPGGGERDYYGQVVSLLDPSNNPVPQTEASAPEQGVRQELCGVKAGMTMAEVLSILGRPKALGISSAGHASLLFGHYCLTFKGDRLERILPDQRGQGERQAGVVRTNSVQNAFALAYYDNLNSLFRTNVLSDSTRMLATNAVISVAKLKAGELGGLKLGMTMSEAVAVRGKPTYFCRFTADRATLWGIGRFHGDRLWFFGVDFPAGKQSIVFDNGLASTNSMSEYVKAFGTPLRLSQYNMTYKFGRTYVRFSFRPYADDQDPVADRGPVMITGISLHYRGAQEVYEEAHDRFVRAVSSLTGIDRAKVQSLMETAGATDGVPLLEKEMGKPLTDQQRQAFAAARASEESAIKRAYEDD